MVSFSVQFNPEVSQVYKNEQSSVGRENGINFMEVMQGMKETVSNIVFVPGSNEGALMNFLKRQDTEKASDTGAKWTTVYDLIAEIERMERDGNSKR